MPRPATTPTTAQTRPAKSARWPSLAVERAGRRRSPRVRRAGAGGALRGRDEVDFLAGGRFDEAFGAGFFFAPDRVELPLVAVTVAKRYQPLPVVLGTLAVGTPGPHPGSTRRNPRSAPNFLCEI